MLTFVVPPLDGPVTGGTRYNRCLVEGLQRLGEAAEVLSLDKALRAVAEPRARRVWVDSLWMASIPQLVQAASPECRVGMLAHYLPSLVSHGKAPPRAALSRPEQAALRKAEGVLAPSEYLAGVLQGLGVSAERIRVLEPGSERPSEPRPAPEGRLRALLVANVTEGKGLAPLLEGLLVHLEPRDSLTLEVVGSLQMEPDYAQACRALVEQNPVLRERVYLRGPCSHQGCIDALQRTNVLVSASRMESYGMALADARACGRPIIARVGGNAAAHVDHRWGGELVPDARTLAEALVGLARNPARLRERQARAWAHRPQRPWIDVASQLLAMAHDWPAPRPP